MDFSKYSISNVFNNLRDEIVNLETEDGRSILNQFIIPDDKGRKDNLFVRKSPLSAPLLIEYLLRHNTMSTQISLDDFFEQTNTATVTKSALSQRRTRLDPNIFTYLNNRFVSECYNKFGEGLQRWNNWYLLACDGSDFALPDTDAVAEVYGRYSYASKSVQKDVTFPMAKAVMISDILNGFTLCGRLFPYRTDERNALDQMLPELVESAPFDLKQAISIYDRGYFSLKLIRDLYKRGLKFVIRMPVSCSVVRDFISSGELQSEIEWTPTPKTSLGQDAEWIQDGRKPIKMRLVRVILDNDVVEVLATNLKNDEVDAGQMKELYFKRWAIEVDYLHYKHAYQIEAFSGGRPICIQQDFNAVILCHNMVCLIIDSEKGNVEERNSSKKIRYKTNVAILVGTFFAVFIDMMAIGKTAENINLLSMTALRCLTPIREHRRFSRKRKQLKSSDRNRTRTNRKRVC